MVKVSLSKRVAVLGTDAISIGLAPVKVSVHCVSPILDGGETVNVRGGDPETLTVLVNKPDAARHYVVAVDKNELITVHNQVVDFEPLKEFSFIIKNASHLLLPPVAMIKLAGQEFPCKCSLN